jgi:antitoxin component YwqK of YwqJK toxin-antitoxin module
MKKYIILAVVMFSGFTFAQEQEPVLEVFGNKVKATYYFDNGSVQQEGFFENGKLQGLWVSFDKTGKKISSGEYNEGVKTGKWSFWTPNVGIANRGLTEVDYSNDTIVSVKKTKQEAIVINK